MPRVQVGYNPGAEALQTTASPNIQAVKAQYDPRSSSAFQLAEALGKAQPVLDKFNDSYERNRALEQQAQLMKLDSYKSQIVTDNNGPVSEAQVGARFPETVPVVRMRIAEGAGAEQGKKLIQPVIDAIMADANLQNDTAARAAFIKQKRGEILGGIPAGNEFYASGAIGAIDKELGQYENQWQRQTATYHKEVQSKDFSGKVVEALGSAEPGKAIEALDANWKVSSSLNNIERNKLVVETVTQQAYATDNPALLDKVPTRFLNAETSAKIQQAKLQITQIRIGKVRDASFLEGKAREDATRGAKTDIVGKLAKGEAIDPGVYRGDPEAFNYAMSMKDAGRLPDVQSVSNATRIRTAVLNGSTVGTMNQNQVIDQIMNNPAINPKEKQALIADVPKLMEGMILLKDEGVQVAMSTRIDARLKVLEGSTNAKIQSLITGGNLRAQAMQVFQQGLEGSFTAYFEDNKQWPTGKAKQEIIRVETEKAERLIEELTRIGTQATPAAPAGGARSGGPAPAAAPVRPSANKPVPTAADIAYAKANPQFKQQFINTFGREP
jgi:hypothetical protein